MNSDLSLWLQSKVGYAIGYAGGVFVVSVVIVLIIWTCYKASGRDLNYRRALGWTMVIVTIGSIIGALARLSD